MSEWKLGKISDLADIITGCSFRGEDYSTNGSLKVVRGENVTIGNLRWDTTKYWNHSTEELKKYFLREDDLVIGMDGSRVGFNRASIRKNELPLILAQRVARLRAKPGNSQRYLNYLILSEKFPEYVEAIHTGTSIPHISQSQIADFDVQYPVSEEIQESIAEVLSSLDNKIDLLHRNNKTMEQLAETLFRQWFVEEADDSWESKTMCTLFDIGIGRTPPRLEKEWFSTNVSDVKWVSIKDMGNCGVYINSTSEFLTRKAINKFNIPVIPSNTLLLSFKMTIGRLAITTETMLSNEAIAHFKPKDGSSFFPEYLYLFFKTYKWEQLGSTSSIVEAINSQMIKNIELLIPPSDKLREFKNLITIYFDKIRSNQRQIDNLKIMRDSLLPKLMSGAVRVTN